MRAGVVLAVSVAAACSQGALVPDASSPDAPITCASGPQRCAGTTLQTCGADGDYHDQQVCPSACDDLLGCVVCAPGTGVCDGTASSRVCNATGTGYDVVACDAVQGVACGASGLCEGACAPRSLGDSYIGCEYFPTVTGNMVSAQFSFAVAISNASDADATVTIEDGSLPVADVLTVPAHGVRVEKLPWYQALKLCTKGTWEECANGMHADAALVDRAAYHLRATEPVTVYQFNPLDYALPGVPESSYSNDASLLLPSTTWRRDYYVASFGVTAGTGNPSELAITALTDGTHVTITTRADTIADGGAPAFTAGVPQMITLGAGGVLELTSRTGDLTGTHVVADAPVQVIGGHYCAEVPIGTNYCDHLEDSMLSVDALGSRYLVSAPEVPSAPRGRIRTVRVIATAPDTHLTYKPGQAGAPTTIANAGDFVELTGTKENFLLTADHKVMVAQYMEGSSAASDHTGDPSLEIVPPIDQYRDTYLFHAPINYAVNTVDVVAPLGDVIMLDQNLLPLEAIGATGYGIVRLPLDKGPAGDGNHRMAGTMPFGISVYGYGTDTSYWYPGGLELRDLPVN